MSSERIIEIILEVIKNDGVFMALSIWATMIIAGEITLGIICYKVLEGLKERIQ